MDDVIAFVREHKDLFDVAQAFSAIANLFAWVLAIGLLIAALRKNRLESLSVGPFNFRMLKEEAIVATATATRAWQGTGGRAVDVQRIRSTVDKVFTPQVMDTLTGKSVLWADDNPRNNDLAVRALKKFGLDVVQVVSTEAALEAYRVRSFDLVISDMGRGQNMRAGYELLGALREMGCKLPFFIFAGSDTPEFRREAAERGAQLSTNDMLELVDHVVKALGEAA